VFRLKFKTTEPTDLENEIARLFKILKDCVPGTARYDEVSDQIAKLYKLKEVDSKSAVSKDAMVGAATNLAGILLILNYEHAHVMTSKAVSFVVKSLK
jgi:hypothetical protein